MHKYTQLFIDKYKLPSDLVLKKKIRGMQGITIYSLIHALLQEDTILEAAKSLGYSDNPVKQCIREVLHSIIPPKGTWESKGGKSSWRTVILNDLGLNKCTVCGEVLSLNEFYSNKSRPSGISSECKYCGISRSKLRKQYILLRTPSWQDLDTLDSFYRNCPNGYHVDHVIPLQGKLVSGLHVINNLQYLTAKDNLSKNNSYIIE